METVISVKVNSLLDEINANYEKAKGETYKFVGDGQKRAAGIARKHLMAIAKAGKNLRKILIEMKKAMPRVKRAKKA